MHLLVFFISIYFFAVALASSVPTPATTTLAVSATTAATVTPTAAPASSPDSSIQYRTVTRFSTPAVYGDLQKYAAFNLDSPIFRKRLYSDRLSLAANYANARDLTVSFLKNTARRVGNYLLTLDYGTIGNIVFRAAVRSLTPGYQLQLLDSGIWEEMTSDVVASAYMIESFPQLPAPPSADNTDAVGLAIVQVPTQLPSLTDLRWGIKYTLAHMDMPALVSLGLKAAVSYFDLDPTFDTVATMGLIDLGMHIVSPPHISPFHRVGDVLRSLDAVFPSLELPSLVSGLPHPPLLQFKSPTEEEEEDTSSTRQPIRFTRPPPSLELERDEEPVVITVHLSESCAASSTTELDYHELWNADRWLPEGLASGYLLLEGSTDTRICVALCIVIAILASGGVMITMRISHGFRKAEQVRQDLIKLHALKSLGYLPWERRLALLKTLTGIKPSRLTKLKPNYKIAIAPSRPEAQIAKHVTRLVYALSPERRKDLVYVLAIASLPPPLLPSSTPSESADDISASSTPQRPADYISLSSVSIPSPLSGAETVNSAETTTTAPSSPQPPPPPPQADTS